MGGGKSTVTSPFFFVRLASLQGFHLLLVLSRVVKCRGGGGGFPRFPWGRAWQVVLRGIEGVVLGCSFARQLRVCFVLCHVLSNVVYSVCTLSKFRTSPEVVFSSACSVRTWSMVPKHALGAFFYSSMCGSACLQASKQNPAELVSPFDALGG